MLSAMDCLMWISEAGVICTVAMLDSSARMYRMPVHAGGMQRVAIRRTRDSGGSGVLVILLYRYPSATTKKAGALSRDAHFSKVDFLGASM